ncbi:uncharacterized protein BO80DRAFT_44181 [Aspergillus ibericus CBS 121593]|uniref:Uncharacterized protein n=1 Tax=Aspergillus ibericus CBS 121593 TaxID=1448316 RepID=A0A395H2H7_9EURO|nr:hypothetical protein BO80DRAFT_44181 [Aspergillus ibericus CBS 121593]RAL01820.1 hypothetical protein BO80DRAFT_44181 [Aspergillus ibericus CBS 121593]
MPQVRGNSNHSPALSPRQSGGRPLRVSHPPFAFTTTHSAFPPRPAYCPVPFFGRDPYYYYYYQSFLSSTFTHLLLLPPLLDSCASSSPSRPPFSPTASDLLLPLLNSSLRWDCAWQPPTRVSPTSTPATYHSSCTVVAHRRVPDSRLPDCQGLTTRPTGRILYRLTLTEIHSHRIL